MAMLGNMENLPEIPAPSFRFPLQPGPLVVKTFTARPMNIAISGAEAPCSRDRKPPRKRQIFSHHVV